MSQESKANLEALLASTICYPRADGLGIAWGAGVVWPAVVFSSQLRTMAEPFHRKLGVLGQQFGSGQGFNALMRIESLDLLDLSRPPRPSSLGDSGD